MWVAECSPRTEKTLSGRRCRVLFTLVSFQECWSALDSETYVVWYCTSLEAEPSFGGDLGLSILSVASVLLEPDSPGYMRVVQQVAKNVARESK